MPRSIFARTTSYYIPRALVAAAASALVLGASVQASPVKTVESTNGRTIRSVEVKFADLDLTSQQGAATLETRLRAASREVCGASSRAPLREQIAHRACVDETLASGKRAMVTLVARAEAGDNFKPGERISVGS